MDAFWSGTDDANENMTQFYGVWGKIKDEQPKFLFRWVCGGKRVNLDASILFDIPQIETKTITTTQVIKTLPGQEPTITEESKEVVVSESLKGPWERVEAPEDWMGQHRKSWGGAVGGYSYKGKTGGATPSGGYDGYRSGYGYGWEDELYDPGYETGITQHGGSGGARRYKDKNDFVEANAEAQGLGSKKNKEEIKEERTEVEIFLEKNLGDENKSIGQVEDTVREIVNELIDLGYDYVVSDTMTESSGYGHHMRYDLY